jgi:hypothetical protein
MGLNWTPQLDPNYFSIDRAAFSTKNFSRFNQLCQLSRNCSRPTQTALTQGHLENGFFYEKTPSDS